MRVIRSRPESVQGPADWFTGTVWFDHIAAGVSPSRLAAISVHFTPGARTAWHAHPNGQVLHVLEGTGRLQLRGGPVEEIRAGDTVVAEAGEWHWHGAAPRNFMTHIAMQEHGDDGAHAEWGAHVTDAEYQSPPAQPPSR
jgi:quercetin dioxygenase-like cupin family protein